MFHNTNVVDKKLLIGDDLKLTESGDMAVVTDARATLQEAQNRCKSFLGSWFFDPEYGSDLYTYIREKGTYQITDEIALASVTKALQPMITDGRLTAIEKVYIEDRTENSLVLQIQILAGVKTGFVTYEIHI